MSDVSNAKQWLTVDLNQLKRTHDSHAQNRLICFQDDDSFFMAQFKADEDPKLLFV